MYVFVVVIVKKNLRKKNETVQSNQIENWFNIWVKKFKILQGYVKYIHESERNTNIFKQSKIYLTELILTEYRNIVAIQSLCFINYFKKRKVNERKNKSKENKKKKGKIERKNEQM